MKKVIVVTGAAGGIGAATVEVLEEHGYEVIPTDKRECDHPSARLIDASDPDAIVEGLADLERIDGVVNNAAQQLFSPLSETTVDEWSQVFATNTTGPFVYISTALDRLIETHGSVVNVSSVHARQTSGSIATYAATKGALSAFTRAAAIELGPMGVRVNAVLPGAVDTDALRGGLWRRPGGEASLSARTPLRRVGEPREIGEAIAFLLDNEKAGFITGAELVVDGGALAQLSTE